MNMNLEVNADMADEITRQTLLGTWHDLDREPTIPMWDTDPDVEECKRRKFKKALRRVLNYYSAPQDQV